MFIQITDLISGQAYDVNSNHICYFSRTTNACGTIIYQIVLTNNTVISVSHKKWNRIRRMVSTV